MSSINLHVGDCLDVLKTMPDKSVHCCVTSPPYYGLRDYGCEGQIGLEKTPEMYVQKLVEVFREVKRVMRDDGTLWLNLGDSYNGSGKAQGQAPDHKNCGRIKQKRGYDSTIPTNVKGLKPKDLIGIPWMVAFALRADGWYLRQDIIWAKPNPMPESVTDRCTKSHEYIFLLSKSKKYYYDAEAIKTELVPHSESESHFSDGTKTTTLKKQRKVKVPDGWDTAPGAHGTIHRNGRSKGATMPDTLGINGNGFKGHSGNYDANGNLLGSGKANKRSVWMVTTKPYKEAHFATFPEDLITDCIKAGCPIDGTVLDPFAGAGTTLLVSHKLGRNSIGIELNLEYVKQSNRRFKKELGMFFQQLHNDTRRT